MTVAELIAILAKLPSDLIITTADADHDEMTTVIDSVLHANAPHTGHVILATHEHNETFERDQNYEIEITD